MRLWKTAVSAVVFAATGGMLAGPEDDFVELAAAWREHVNEYEWNADPSWLPLNHEHDSLSLEPYADFGEQYGGEEAVRLWRSRSVRVLVEGQRLIDRMIEASRAGPFEAEFNTKHFLQFDAFDWPSGVRRCANALAADARRCYSGGDVDEALERLATIFRIVGQCAESGTTLGAMTGAAIGQMQTETLGMLLDTLPEDALTEDNTRELRDAIDELDREDPVGLLRAYVNEAERVLAWARASEDPVAELFEAERDGHATVSQYVEEGVRVPGDLESFRGWLIFQFEMNHELLVFHAEHQAEAVGWLTEHWDTLSEDRSEDAWKALRAHTLVPFTGHPLEAYDLIESEFGDAAWKKRSTLSLPDELWELRVRLGE